MTQIESKRKEEFIYEFLVECPRCKECARVVPIGTAEPKSLNLLQDRRLTCIHCGLSKDRTFTANINKTPSHDILEKQTKIKNQEDAIYISDIQDWYFQCDLWLKVSCCGETLAAYNRDHLLWLEDFVKATLREGQREHHSMAARLPEWVKAAKNRDEILKCIHKLKTL